MSIYKCEKGKEQYKMCKKYDADYCSDCPHSKKIEEKIKELESNRTYLSKFNDWKEKDYTNEDIIDNCVEVLKELLEEEK